MSPAVVVSERAAVRLRGGNPWVYAEDVVRAPDGEPEVVRVLSAAGRLLGSALYSAKSPLPVRLFDRGEATFDTALLGRRLDQALARRRALFPKADAYRVVHGEADQLPGLIVDRYADVAVVQTLARAMDAHEAELGALVAERLGARLVVARDDGSARDFEGLPRKKAVLAGSGSPRVRWHDGENVVEVDVLEDGKTGGYLDQCENHARAAGYATGDALDAFTYHGGFALALARGGCRSVLALDESAAAVARARANAEANGLSQVRVEQQNAFDALRSLEAEGRRFDVVVIDPPALAKRKSALKGADRAYKELNLRALRLLSPGGLLISCSCSGKITPLHFGELIGLAARDVGRPLQLLERCGAGRDHPPLVGLPETDYLKCWFLRAVD